MNQTFKTKQKGKAKDKRPKKKAVGSVQQVHTHKGHEQVLHLWKVGRGIGLSCGSLHPEISWWGQFILSRSECEWLLLQLQHQFGRKPVGVRTETWAHKSGGAIQIERSNIKSRRKLVSTKNR